MHALVAQLAERVICNLEVAGSIPAAPANLEEENYSLRIKVTHLKKKFKKMLKFLHDKLFGWGKKDSIYNQVVNDFYNHDILNDNDLDSIRKDDHIGYLIKGKNNYIKLVSKESIATNLVKVMLDD